MNLKMLTTILTLSLSLTPDSPGLAAFAPQDNSRDKALLEAVEKGDRQKVLALLAQGANVNARGVNDALETAIFRQDVEMARLLLDKGARIRAGDLGDAAHGTQGDTTKATMMVRLLLEKGADLRACHENVTGYVDRESSPSDEPCKKTAGENALREAASRNNLDVMRLLLTRSVPLMARIDSARRC
jgi:ankyrin repeat protein